MKLRIPAALAVIGGWGVTVLILGLIGTIEPLTAGIQVAIVLLVLLLAPSILGIVRTVRGSAAHLKEVRDRVRSLEKEIVHSRRCVIDQVHEASMRALESRTSSDAALEKERGGLRAAGPSRSPERTLALDPRSAEGTEASRRVNAMLGVLPKDARYLEIGLDRGKTFEAVVATERWGVDPRPRFSVTAVPEGATLLVTTSDRFFELVSPETCFDVVYVDGLHRFEQTYRDLIHAFAHIQPRGAALVDDVVPVDEVSAIPDQHISLSERARRGLPGRPWHGDVFRLIKVLADHHSELEIRTIVGAGNQQALVWRSDPEASSAPISGADLRSYGQLNYTDTFDMGIPEYFNPCSEAEALTDFSRFARGW